MRRLHECFCTAQRTASLAGLAVLLQDLGPIPAPRFRASQLARSACGDEIEPPIPDAAGHAEVGFIGNGVLVHDDARRDPRHHRLPVMPMVVEIHQHRCCVGSSRERSPCTLAHRPYASVRALATTPLLIPPNAGDARSGFLEGDGGSSHMRRAATPCPVAVKCHDSIDLAFACSAYAHRVTPPRGARKCL